MPDEPTDLDNALLYIRRLEAKLANRDARILELEAREANAWGYYRARGKKIELLKQHITPYTLKFLGMEDDDE